MKILFLSRWFPYPTNNGAKLRIYNLLRGLAQVHEVYLISFSDDPQNAEVEPLKAFCREVRVAPWREFQPGSARAFMGLFSQKPRVLADTYSMQMEQEIRQMTGMIKFDLVIFSQWLMTSYRHLIQGIPVLYEEVEIGVPYEAYANAANPLAKLRNGLTWMKQREYLAQLIGRQGVCTVVSEREKRLLANSIPGNRSIHVIPNGVHLADYTGIQEDREPGSIIFTGSFRYLPNYQAVLWFLKNVFPRVQEQAPGASLTITGDPNGLSLPSCKGVRQTGYVDDVRPYIARSCVSVVPLQTGGGTRLKILEAMALKTAVVSTSKGAEGLEARAGEHLFIADDAEAFARHIVELLRSPQLSEKIATNAWRFVREQYDWQIVLPKLLSVVQQAAA